MTGFHGKILFMGFGAVAHCTLPIFLRHVRVRPESITVLDFEDRSADMQQWTAQGIRFVRERVAPENLGGGTRPLPRPGRSAGGSGLEH